ncbi:sodium/hydrogen exchanger family protein [Gemmatimonas aurantiaca T-27]|uniref:Sodium/hydrogen exchanger family protein n=2 Tax=Gemmatimonas aurantiaca TaxID=173480 RepID=C1A508_GEMAT|nr:sodium/hydrogen exchanger family protein [Gemmatimonas aurantiaca T-27]
MGGIFVLGGADAGAPTLMLFGFLILGAYSVGELVKPFGIPKIVGYLLAGILFGPPGLGYVSKPVLAELNPVSNLAIALIAFLAGAELQMEEIKARGAAILKMVSVELVLSFVSVTAVVLVLREQLPFMATAPLPEAAAFSMLFAAVAVVHSPAVTMALLTETRASGPVARYTLGVVLVMDVAVVLIFSLVLAAARSMAPPAGDSGGVQLGAVVWEIGGSVIVGAVLGVGIAAYLRFISRELFIFGLLVALLGAEVARILHVETLLTLLVAGFVAENAGGGRGAELRHALERAAAPVFVVFFALSGAKIDPRTVLPLWMIVIPVVLVRMGGIWAGMQLGGRWARLDPLIPQRAWLGLVSQAGVAIGLATVVADVYPTRGGQLRDLLLATIAINETIGPILFRLGLKRAGELDASDPSGVHALPEPKHA